MQFHENIDDWMANKTARACIKFIVSGGPNMYCKIV